MGFIIGRRYSQPWIFHIMTPNVEISRECDESAGLISCAAIIRYHYRHISILEERSPQPSRALLGKRESPALHPLDEIQVMLGIWIRTTCEFDGLLVIPDGLVKFAFVE